MSWANDERNNLLDLYNENKYYDKDYQIDCDNKNNSHSIIVDSIKEGSLVLDVGCASGVVGKYLHSEKKCTVYGIDIDKKSVEIAKKTKAYEKIYCMNLLDIEDKEVKSFFDNDLQFDFIILADVIEHLYDPAEMINILSEKLRVEGNLIISIPNIAHSDIIVGLLNGKFNYSKTGILDNTHVRFFTKKSFAEYISDINKKYKLNFDLELIASTTVKVEAVVCYEKLNQLLSENKETDILQHVYKLTLLNSKSRAKGLNKLLREEPVKMAEKIDEKIMKLNDELIKSNSELAHYNRKGFKLVNRMYIVFDNLILKFKKKND